jgi:hypothetical protein
VNVINWFASAPLFIFPKHIRNSDFPVLVMYITDSLPGPMAQSAGYVLPCAIGVLMPLTPFLKEATFDPEAIKAMSAAFEAVCEALRLAPRNDPITESGAKGHRGCRQGRT